MTLSEIKRWRAESTAHQASMTFISRVDRLIEIAEAAEKVVFAWQNFCDRHKDFKKGFEDHLSLYDLAETITRKNNKNVKGETT